MSSLRAPFPYFGGKSRVAALVWERFGDVLNYVEPFFGSGAVLLARPHAPRTETVNDMDALLANFWRALQHDPEQVAYWADWPVNEVDLHARHLFLVNHRAFVEELMTDPDAYDAKLAGWWVWGISQWIGGGWCKATYDGTSGPRKDGSTQRRRPALCRANGVHRKRPAIGGRGKTSSVGGIHRAELHRKMPSLGDQGRGDASTGVSRQLPSLGDRGRGVAAPSRQLPHLQGDSGASGRGIHASAFERKTGGIYDYMEALAERLRRVRVCCGDWTRVLGPSVTEKHGVTGIFLDPPYSHAEREEVYSEDHDVAADVRAWAIANGNNPLLRIALCGYEGEHEMPEGWVAIKWKAAGGYGSQGEGRGRENANRETIWFSPFCRNGVESLPLFAGLEAA